MARSRNRRRRSNIIWLALLFLVTMVIVANVFESSWETKPVQPSATGRLSGSGLAGGRAQPADSYALRPLANNWPAADDVDSVLGKPKDYLTRNYYVVMDASGSMKDVDCSGGQTKMQVAIDALEEFTQALPAGSNFGLALFNDNQIGELVPLGQASRGGVKRLMQGLVPAGSTPLRTSINFAYEKVTEQARKQLGYGEYHIVVLTDGMASDGQDPGRIVNAILKESPISLQTIGFCIGEDHILNQPGRSHYKAADNVEELRSGLQDVLAESPGFDVGTF